MIRAQQAVLERHDVEAGQRQHEPRRLVINAERALEPDLALVAVGRRVGQLAISELVADGEAGIVRVLGGVVVLPDIGADAGTDQPLRGRPP